MLSHHGSLPRSVRLLPRYQPDAIGAGNIHPALRLAGQEALESDGFLARRDVRTTETRQREAEMEDHVQLAVSVHVHRVSALRLDVAGLGAGLPEPYGGDVDRRGVEGIGAQDGDWNGRSGLAAPRVREAPRLDVEANLGHWWKVRIDRHGARRRGNNYERQIHARRDRARSG